VTAVALAVLAMEVYSPFALTVAPAKLLAVTARRLCARTSSMSLTVVDSALVDLRDRYAEILERIALG
jgi:hypothetical protein